jgi:S-adenosylmethionine:tRNA ribosyltransferase-isomerase
MRSRDIFIAAEAIDDFGNWLLYCRIYGDDLFQYLDNAATFTPSARPELQPGGILIELVAIRAGASERRRGDVILVRDESLTERGHLGKARRLRQTHRAMRVDLFDFDLPTDLIAQRPVRPRDAARLLVIGAATLEDRLVRDLPALLRSGDLLVCNDTRVIPARLLGRRGAARIEVTLHQPVGDAEAALDQAEPARADAVAPRDAAVWRTFARPARRCRIGDRLQFGTDFEAEVLAKGDGGEITLAFGCTPEVLLERLETCGQMPLPPYIRRPPEGDARDRADYQTMFAVRAGAIAAPTAALHFTPQLMRALAARRIGHALVTLHVGAGTFLPVKAADTGAHRMHAEWYAISREAAARINAARASGGRIVAVGTTVLRTLETIADPDGQVRPAAGETRLFITPGYRVKAVDLLLTNFHLPRSTLFMLVAAFAGLARMRTAYAHAIRAGYRFYSYGDACLLERADAAR